MSKILELLAKQQIEKSKGSGIDFYDLTPWSDQEMVRFYPEQQNTLSWRIAKKHGKRNPADNAKCPKCNLYWLHCRHDDKWKW